MYGVPSGVVWDPAGGTDVERDAIEEGFVIAAADIALARPPLPVAPPAVGTVDAIAVAGAAAGPARMVQTVRALDGDRHVAGSGTFPSGLPGSAPTMIEAEVCESFEPRLEPGEHRRNAITRVRAVHGMQQYAGRPVLRALVHRGGYARTSCATARSTSGTRSGPLFRGRLRRRPWGPAAGHPCPAGQSRPRPAGRDAGRNGPTDAERSEAH